MQGGVLHYHVERANGEVEHFDPLHNILLNSFAITYNKFVPGGQLYCRTHSDRLGQDVPGTWQQSGNTISRVSGTGTITAAANWFAVFADGTRTWLSNTYTAATSVTATKSQNAPPQALRLYNLTVSNASNQLALRISNESLSASYSSGLVTVSVTGVRIELPPALTVQTVSRISVSPASPNSNFGSSFDLPSDLVLNVGDTVVITGYSYTIAWDPAVKTFSAGQSPVVGYRGSGKWQRTLTPLDQSAPAPSTMYLIASANKVTLSNLSATTLLPNTFTSAEVISASYQVTSATIANNLNHQWAVKGTTVTGANNVAQIAIGSSSGIYCVFELDTPVNIPANRLIKIVYGMVFDIGIPIDPAPTNTVAPVLSKPGANYVTSDGTWNGYVAYFTYQWYRNSTLVPGETTNTYTQTGSLANADTLYCKVRAVNSGAPSGVAQDSNTVTISLGSPPSNSVAPVITGTDEPGEVLSVSDGTWSNSPTGYSRQWTRDGVDISGATNSTYTLLTGDHAKAIGCKVTATNAFGTSSPATATALDVLFTPIPTPDTIAISFSAGVYSLPSPPSWVYQTSTQYIWMANGVDQSNGTTYSPGTGVAASVNIQLRVRGYNATKESFAYSNSIPHVRPPENSVAPTIGWSGASTYYGSIKVLNTGTWSGSPSGFSYQWNKNGADVAGQTTDTWGGTLALNDDLYCKVTATGAGGNSAVVNSNTMVDYVPYATAMVYAEDLADQNDYIVAQWNTLNNGSFPNEILFPQADGGSYTGTVSLELRLPGAGTYYVRLLNRNITSGDSAPDSTLTVTAT